MKCNKDLPPFFKFSLSSHVYAAVFDGAVIILDSKADKYLSLIDDAAKALQFVLAHEFTHANHAYRPVDGEASFALDYWIAYFLEKEFIVPALQSISLNKPLKSGGLVEYRWNFKKSWKPFSQARWIDICKAYFALHRIHTIMKKKGIAGIFEAIKIKRIPADNHMPTAEEIQRLSAAVDAATLLYHKKTVCLPWAATFTVLALQRNWKVNFVIGVQTVPFYAHAWAETSTGVVINDDPSVAQVLSVLFKQPHI